MIGSANPTVRTRKHDAAIRPPYIRRSDCSRESPLRGAASAYPARSRKGRSGKETQAARDCQSHERLAAISPPPAAPLKMLTLVAIVAGPIVLTTIVTIAIFEIKDAWDRNRLR
jgi:hypothetical protein